ncbi:MAG TPA: efflux RND transporter permease subunit [Steroidobacteraceae bacterium]|jgi:HAE1 family hydrophobic/amphiphilic exporter-1
MIHVKFALRRPVTTLMTFVAVVLIGLLSLKLLPLELFPDIRFPGILVNIPYEGSTPEEVEQLITRPAEEAVATLSGIKEMRSTSSENGLEMIVFFEWGRDPAAVGFEVRTKLESIRHEFPASANRVITRMFAAGDDRVVVVRISSQEDLSRQYDMLDRYLKKPIERLDGVARVSLEGVEPLELRILVDPVRLAAHGVDVARLRDALEGANFSVSAGEVTGGQQRFLVRPIGEFRTLDDVRDFIVTGGIRLRDIADVRLVSPALTVGRHLNGRPGVGLDVFKATGANIVDVADRVMAVVDEARQLPQLQGVDVIVLANQAENIRSSLGELRNAGLIGAALALVVLFSFLRDWPTTLIVSLAVPFSLLMTLAAMYFLGFSLNILTMMGMMLAVGLLVDNAVVVTESIFRHRQMNGGDPIASTYSGVTEVGLAVLAGTLSTVIVFLPIVFGEESELSVFMVHVAVPIVISMVASLFVAQTIIPTLTARFPSPPPIRAGSRFARVQEWYLRRLDWMFAHKWWSALIVLLTVVSAVVPLATGMLKVDMFPQDASDRLQLQYHIEGTYPLARTEEAVTRVENYLAENQERFGIELVYSYYTPNDASSVIKLRPQDELPMEPREIMKEIEQGLPEIIIGKPTFSFEENQGGTGGFSMRLTGESTEQLVGLSRTLVTRLRDVPGFDTVRTTARAGEHEVQVIVDRDRASRLGLTPEIVAQTLAAAMRGDRLKEFRAEDREIEMRLAFRADDRQTLEDLAATPLWLPDGSRSTLGAVASFRIDQTERSIERVDRLTSVVIEGIVSRDSTLDEVKEGVEAAMKEFPLPAGVAWQFGRSVEENDETARDMLVNILLAVVLIYLVMASLFESLLYPVSIITSIVFAIVGVFWGLTISLTPLTFMAMLGIMILIGVIVNIGIVLIAHVIDLRKAGMNRHDAIIEAARHRLRPILMTSLTTLLAMLPIAAGDTQIGGDGPSYYPMARALMSGLFFGSVTSLFFVPMFYVWLDDLNEWRQRVRLFSRGGAAAAGAGG